MFSRMRKIGIASLFVFISVISLANQCVSVHGGKNAMIPKAIKEVLRDHTGELMSLPGVVGTAQGLCDSKPCIKVFVTEKTPELEKRIPHTIEGYPVSIEVTGEFRRLPKNQP